MSNFLSREWSYRLATTLILGGFAMLCQPFVHAFFVVGFPVLLAGVVLFTIVDHVPDTRPSEEEKNG